MGNQAVVAPIDFYSMVKNTIEVNGATSNCLVTHILQNTFFYFRHKKLEQRETRKWQNFNFWVNYPFMFMLDIIRSLISPYWHIIAK